jgi:uncharacterized protein (TIRG00374 family)
MKQMRLFEKNLPEAEPRKRRGWLTWLKIILSGALLYLLYHVGFIRLEDLRSAANNPWLLAAASALVLGSLPLLCLRWYVLLKGLGVQLSFMTILYIWCAGYLGNFFLPGSAGGDAVRLAYLAVRAKGQRSLSMLTVIVDRYLSLIGLFTVALIFVPLRWNLILAIPALQLLTLSALGLFIGGVVVLAAALFLSLSISNYLYKRKWQDKGIAKRIFLKLWEALLAYRNKPLPLLYCWVITIGCQIMLVGSIALIGTAMGNDTLQLEEYAFISSFATLANVLPLTPGGLGIGEAAFAQIAKLVSQPNAVGGYASILLGFRAVSFIVSVLTTLLVLAAIRPRKQR